MKASTSKSYTTKKKRKKEMRGFIEFEYDMIAPPRNTRNPKRDEYIKNILKPYIRNLDLT